MSILGLSEHIGVWSCQNDKCGKKFKAKIVKIEYVEVTRKVEDDEEKIRRCNL